MSEDVRAPSGFLPIAGYETLYEVSAAGAVRSLRSGKILAWTDGGHGYPSVLLYGPDGRKRHRIHQVVCRTFRGPPEPGQEVAHLDGDKANPSLSNVVWATRSENNRHKELHGTHQAGERAANVRLTRQQVDEIRARAGTDTKTNLAKIYGVGRTQITRIIAGEQWHD